MLKHYQVAEQTGGAEAEGSHHRKLNFSQVTTPPFTTTVNSLILQFLVQCCAGWPLHCSVFGKALQLLSLLSLVSSNEEGEHLVPSCPSAKCRPALMPCPMYTLTRARLSPTAALHIAMFIFLSEIYLGETTQCYLLPCIVHCPVSAFCLTECV